MNKITDAILFKNYAYLNGLHFPDAMRKLVSDILMTGITHESMYCLTQKIHLMAKGDRNIQLGRMIRYHYEITGAKLN